MPRETFPYGIDRKVITYFLAGVHTFPFTSISTAVMAPGFFASDHLGISSEGTMLYTNGQPVAYYNERGDVMGILTGLSGVHLHYAIKTQNAMLEALGDPRRITMKTIIKEVLYAGEAAQRTAPHLDEIEIPVNQPWVIAGRLTIMAWRAEQGANVGELLQE